MESLVESIQSHEDGGISIQWRKTSDEIHCIVFPGKPRSKNGVMNTRPARNGYERPGILGHRGPPEALPKEM